MAGRYSAEELRDMARQTIAARHAGDQRYLQLVIALSVRQGLDPREVAARIEALAAQTAGAAER